MRIVYKKPKLFFLLRWIFGVRWGHCIFTYGNTIYTFRELTPEELVHEQVHIKQQGKYPFFFVLRYIFDKKFRKLSELEAYTAQYLYMTRK